MNEISSTTLVDRVEARIRALFREGLPLTAEVCQHIEATLGAADPDTVADLLHGAEESERDTLLELVFFPDTAFQNRLETVLAGGGLTTEDRARLAARLKAAPPAAILVFPDDPQQLGCDLPNEGVDAFLTRLNLTWSIAPRLLDALAQWDQRPADTGGADVPALIVKLRNAALQQTPVQIRLLMDFLERMPANHDRWKTCFDFLLSFLSEHEDTLNFYRALMARKLFLVRHLIKARQQAEALARSNMETLSMTGFRVAHFDTAAAEQALGCIDAIALAVYGRTEHFDDAPVSRDWDEMDASDIDGIVRRLI